MTLTPKNWKEFQHYSDRKPAWIKLHRGLLDDFEFSRLPVASKALAPLLWLLASEYEGGEITASVEEIAFRLRMSMDDLTEALSPLIDASFFVASEPLAEREQNACPEKEDKNRNKEEKDIRAVAPATRPSDAAFEEFWKVYPRRDGANPKTPAAKKFAALAKSGVDPGEMIAAAKRYAGEMRSKGQEGTPYVAQAITWLNQQRWGDYPEAAAPTSEATAITPEKPSWDVWKAHYRDTGQQARAAMMDRFAAEGKPFTVPSALPPDRRNAA